MYTHTHRYSRILLLSHKTQHLSEEVDIVLDNEFTFFNSKAVAPFLQGDVLVLVGVTLLKEACYAVLHGHQGSSQRSKFGMCQDSAKGQ